MNKQDILKKCSEKDFDGHTDFKKMTPKQKLLWLSNTAYFVYQTTSKKLK